MTRRESSILFHFRHKYMYILLVVVSNSSIIIIIYFMSQVNTENLHFMQNRDVYCKEYFEFIRHLSFCNDVRNTCTCTVGRERGREHCFDFFVINIYIYTHTVTYIICTYVHIVRPKVS